MELEIEQSCPQCGGNVTLIESSRLLTCPYCGTKLFLQSDGVQRYVLPAGEENRERELVYAPYLRFKGSIFLVTDSGISHRMVDTTQQGTGGLGLPPSLGVRPQAMKLKRLVAETGGTYLKLSLKAKDVLEKAIQVSELSGREGTTMLHRAFIGETVSFIYLPLAEQNDSLVDGVNGIHLTGLEKFRQERLTQIRYNPRWQIRFLPTLCPRCGGGLDGESDSVVMTCDNCQTAWEMAGKTLSPLNWQVMTTETRNVLHLPFWKISVRIPLLGIESFADFIECTNQPMIPRPQWRRQLMSFWIPAFKLRPKIFLQVARQATLAQWRIIAERGRVLPSLYPVTLPSSEARQSIKVCLAATSAARKRVFELLPQVRLADVNSTLVFLPFIDKIHDWLQPQTGTVIPKNILRFGRSM